MKKINFLLLAIVLVSQPLSAQQQPVDAAVKSALYDIERAEKQATGLTPARKSNIKRVQMMLAGAETRLNQSGNKQHPSWKNAKKRLDALKRKLAQLTSGGTKPATRTAPPTASPRPAATPRAAQAGTAQLTKYDLAQLGTVDRQTESLIKQVQQVDPLDFGQQNIARRWRDHVVRMKNLYLKISHPKHPTAMPVVNKINALNLFVEDRIKKAGAAEAGLGDVKSRYAEIEQRMRTVRVPYAPSAPFTQVKVLAFASELKALETAASNDHAWLKSIKGKTKTVAASQIDGLLHQTEYRHTEIERARTQLARRFDDKIEGAMRTVNRIRENGGKQTSATEWDAKQLNEAMDVISLANAFDSAMGRKATDQSANKTAYEEALGLLSSGGQADLAATRFPRIRSTNAELLQAAKKVLSNPTYKVNPIRRMAITYDKQRKTTAVGDIDWGAAQTTISVTGYVWDEFAVTTVEKVGDKFYLYYNLLKFFHKGGTDVPTGKWTLGERRKGKRILAENIEK